MFHSLYEKVLGLPEDTRVFAGHEYTVRNRAFCLSVDSANRALRAKLEEAKALCERGIPTVPGTLRTEKETNVFLRCKEPSVMQAVRAKVPGTKDDPVSVFACLRAMRDVY